MQIKTTMRYHLTPVRMAIIKKIYKQEMLERVWKKRERTTLTPTVGRNINCCSHYGEWYGGSLENRAINRATI